ncbi:MAG TPA: general stress protein [Candidatus Baltobacteraceae bacterium]|nr:general stress protein [Candidatus Baltobacteraceae bacterium]
MAKGNQRLETGLFYNRHDAEMAVRMLRDLGYGEDEISVMMSDQTRTREFAEATGTKAAEGTTAGGLIGGTLGGIAAAMSTTIAGTVITGGAALPFMAGPIAAVLAGIGAGGIVGGVIGALVGAGIPEHRAHEIEAGLKEGGIMVAVAPREEPQRQRVNEVLNPPQPTRRVTTEAGEVEPTELTPDDQRVPPRRTVP